MFKNFQKLLISILLVFFLMPQVALSENEEVEVKNLSKKVTFSSEKELYNYAQKNLNKYTYRTYRTAERIIRANDLAQYPWVIEFLFSDDYEINASTSNSNLISLKPGILYTFYDDVSALAAVISHEMAHQQLKHIKKRQREFALIDKQYEENLKSLKLQVEKAEENTLWSKVFPVNQSKKIERKKKKLEKLKLQIKDDKNSIMRKQEYEADKLALQYVIKAGFAPQAFKKIFNLHDRDNGTFQEDSNHPLPKNRIWQIETQLKSLNQAKLDAEGAENIANSKPLTFETKGHYKYKYLMKKTLVIHSQSGTNKPVNKPFEELFGY